MPDFSHLKKYNPSPERTAEFKIRELPNAPVLEVAAAGETNPGYYAAQLERAGANARRGTPSISKEHVDEVRNEEREMYAKHVVRGWRNVLDVSGAAVEFNPQNCLEFLRAIPAYIFDDLRAYCSTQSHFVPRVDAGK